MSGKLCAPVRGVGDRLAVARPHRVDVQRAVHRDPARVGAVVVGDVDLLDPAVVDRALHPLAVAIGREGELGPGDAGQVALLLVDLVGDRVREDARVGGRAAVFLRERRGLAGDVVQPHLDDDAGPRLAHRADDQALGAELAPAIERHGVDRRRHRDRGVGVARHHVELALEVEVGPQHLADRGGDRLALGIGRRGEEVGHGELRLAAADAGDRADAFARLLLSGRRRGRLLRRRAGHCGNRDDAHGNRRAQADGRSENGSMRHRQRMYSNVRFIA